MFSVLRTQNWEKFFFKKVVLTLSVPGGCIAVPSGTQLYRTLSPELRSFRNSRSYHWKEHKILMKIGWFWGALPPQPMSCWRKTSVRNFWIFFFKRSKALGLKGLSEENKIKKFPNRIRTLLKHVFSAQNPKLGIFFFLKSRLNPFSPRELHSNPFRDPTLPDFISGTKRFPELS